MRRQLSIILPLLLTLLLAACDNAQTSVPAASVYLKIDTRRYFSDFNPSNTGSYVIVDRDGYHHNGLTQPLLAGQMTGYAGVLLIMSMDGHVSAFDRCCPHCLDISSPLQPTSEITTMLCRCPLCGEEYDIYSVTNAGVPQRGISKMPLRYYQAYYNESDGVITVRN